MSSLDFEEAGHKLMKISLLPGQEREIPIMIIECCSQERTYNKYYGLLGARFCMLRKEFQVRPGRGGECVGEGGGRGV
jgi:pre-mRNA-splicing factor CWC22